MKGLRQCIRELRTMRDGPIRDVVLPIIAALEGHIRLVPRQNF
jgi:hypothetical protein